MSGERLTPQQRVEADRIHAALVDAAAEDLRELAELLATKDDSTIFGDTEFAVRDIVLRVGAAAVEAALKGREKKVTTAPPGPAPGAAGRPSSNAGSPGRS